MVKCKCGQIMDFLKYENVDVSREENKMYVDEVWECLECGEKITLEVEGAITKIR